MKKIFAFVAFSAALVAPSYADVVYISSAEFLPHVAGGAYREGFQGVMAVDNHASFGNGVYSYDVAASEGLYFSGTFIGTAMDNDNLVVSFTGAPVTAVGGTIYATDVSDGALAAPMTITLNNGTTTSYTSFDTAFVGFTSDIAISSLTISRAGAGTYVSLGDLTVGTAVNEIPAVPEPASVAMLVAGMACLVIMFRSRAPSSAT